MKQLLLCSDLDRTLIPNGSAPESAQARPLFNLLAAHPKFRLAYVTGRDKKLVEQAIGAFNLPEPEFVIGDVGTTLYHLIDGQWISNRRWRKIIGRDWEGYSHEDIISWLHESGLCAGRLMASKILIQIGNDFHRRHVLAKEWIHKRDNLIVDVSLALSHVRMLRDAFVNGIVQDLIKPILTNLPVSVQTNVWFDFRTCRLGRKSRQIS
jgi:hydroxymethylpyrimidine pyrophosphatase-like HAD family hydrolase